MLKELLSKDTKSKLQMTVMLNKSLVRLNQYAFILKSEFEFVSGTVVTLRVCPLNHEPFYYVI